MSGERDPVVVIGSGIAGLTFALRAAEFAPVLLITKKSRADSNTNWARGGIAAVMGEDDNPSLHLRDTLLAGAGLCHREVAAGVVAEGPARIRDLVEWGTRFQEGERGLSLGREGGHSRRRIVHAGDRTGASIERALLAAVEADPAIRVEEDLMAVELVVEEVDGSRRCVGVSAIRSPRGRVATIPAAAVLLASGGSGQAYLHTTNPTIATGDGVAMAFRAGAPVANMEFVQFHPTALFPTEDPAFLISEAVRGEGAVLRTLDGRDFMAGRHPLASLAPRDVVAREIQRELRESGADHVVLDVTAIDVATFGARFPGTLSGCRDRGVDPWDGGIPVVPAAHYQCGGVWTDARGATGLPGLFAAGEVACTGLHGANRLASNSLLEAVVYSSRAAAAVRDELAQRGLLSGAPAEEPELPAALSEWGEGATGSPVGDGGERPGPGGASRAAEVDPRVHAARMELRTRMWASVGIVRTVPELEEAREVFAGLLVPGEASPARPAEGDVAAVWGAGGGRGAGRVVTAEEVELGNLSWVAWLTAASALGRRESRGLHTLVEHPGRDNERGLRDTVLTLADLDPAMAAEAGAGDAVGAP
jgi:L-aspartate oxidase